MSGQPEAITEAELAEALRERSYLPDPAAYARDIFADVRRNREPEYEPGEVYRSPDGRTWFRMRRSAVDPDATPGWRCCESGTVYNHSWPARSLRKMVPEEAPLPEPRITCAACRHTAPSMSEVAWQPDWKQWRCTDPAACHKRQQEAGMEGDDVR